jgi:hypothetical protein
VPVGVVGVNRKGTISVEEDDGEAEDESGVVD